MQSDRHFEMITRATASEGSGGGSAGAFNYTIGDVEVTAIHDGYFEMPLDGFIKNASDDEVKDVWAASGAPRDTLRIPFTSTVLKVAGKTIVIDTSYGEFGPPTAGKWMQSFRAAGFDPAKVDMVIFSHFHGDHINGYRGKDGSSPFTKAEVLVPKAEWDYWMDEERRKSAPEGLKGTFDGTHRVFDPIKDKVKTFAAGEEIAPGLTAIAVPGHTPGHTAFSLTSRGEKLILLSDTSNNPLIFAPRPDFVAVFDMDGAQAAASRRKMFQHAVDEKAQVTFFHAPFPGTGHLVAEGKAFKFVPLAAR